MLLASLAGNVLSGVLWLFSRDFATYLVSRAVGGLSEANVQLALASLADVTPVERRATSMALVGLAFSLAFVAGPLIGARLATARLPRLPLLDERHLNVYAFPAALTVGLLLVETAILAAFLPETLPGGERGAPTARRSAGATKRLRQLERLHLLFLLLFSGVETSLTLCVAKARASRGRADARPSLTFDVFGFTNREQGALLGSMGLLAALLQGTVVRRGRLTPAQLALFGLVAGSASFAGLALVPVFARQAVLRLAAALLAVTSATVVTSLTALASAEAGAGEQGAVLGRFRSNGQLGRALGPVVAVTLYWTVGPTATYGLGAVAMAALVARTADGALAADPPGRPQSRKAQ